jgi:hypothetical protein
MGAFSGYHDVRKIDCNWKIAFIYLETSETFIICIFLLIMRLWGLTFHLEMRKSNHEFIFLHISTSQSTAWRRKLYKWSQRYGIWPCFIAMLEHFRPQLLFKALLWEQVDQCVSWLESLVRISWICPALNTLKSPDLRTMALSHLHKQGLQWTDVICQGIHSPSDGPR